MKKLKSLLFGEKSLTKIVQVCENEVQAEQVARELVKETELHNAQVKILNPAHYDPNNMDIIGLKMEPESAGIFRTILKTHLVFGVIGGIFGLGLYAVLSQSVLIASTPVQSFIAVVGFSITFALLVAGLVSLRPDHVRVITKIKQSLSEDKWVVITHPLNGGQEEQTLGVLGEKAIKTL